MESLYLLIPLSAGLVLLILAVFGWALHRGQFDDLEREGERILDEARVPGPRPGGQGPSLDADQARPQRGLQESVHQQPMTE